MTDAFTTLCTIIGAGFLALTVAFCGVVLASLGIDRLKHARAKRDESMTPRLGAITYAHDGRMTQIRARSPRAAIAELTGERQAQDRALARAMARGVSR